MAIGDFVIAGENLASTSCRDRFDGRIDAGLLPLLRDHAASKVTQAENNLGEILMVNGLRRAIIHSDRRLGKRGPFCRHSVAALRIMH